MNCRCCPPNVERSAKSTCREGPRTYLIVVDLMATWWLTLERWRGTWTTSGRRRLLWRWQRRDDADLKTGDGLHELRHGQLGRVDGCYRDFGCVEQLCGCTCLISFSRQIRVSIKNYEISVRIKYSVRVLIYHIHICAWAAMGSVSRVDSYVQSQCHNIT